MTAYRQTSILNDPLRGPSRRQLLMGAGGLAAAAVLASCSSGTSPDGNRSPTGTPKRGGNFRLGVTGGGSKDLFDGQTSNAATDTARLYTAFETLTVFDDNYKLSFDGLAESVEADNPTQYTIRLRQGIEFHNGKTLSADDVIYSLQRIATEANGLTGFSATETMDIANLAKMDKYTIRLPLKVADSALPKTFAHYAFSIVPVGYEAFSGDVSTQVGTGAYKLKSFTPGQESIHDRNANYWRGDGSPWFDRVTISNYSDSTGQLNAFLGGQLDAMTDLPAAQIASVKAQDLNVLTTQTGSWTPMCMAIDMPPFDDVRVRQAFRLIPDREAMLNQVLSGYGDIGNDIFGRYDVAYNDELPQRNRDIDEAKALLKAAGHENLTVDLYTTPARAGMVEMATVFAQQAKDAGVTVNVKNLPSDAFYTDYGKYAFYGDVWTTTNYIDIVRFSSLPNSVYNAMHWPPKSGEGSNYVELYEQAIAEYDEAKQIEILHEMQQIEYDLGGNIIPFFPAKIDGYAANLRGLSETKQIASLAGFGHGYRTIWFD